MTRISVGSETEDEMKAKEKLDATKEFARRVIQAMWDGGDVDGGDVQNWAQELGLIYTRKATKQDEDDFSEICAGDDMFEFERWLRRAYQ